MPILEIIGSLNITSRAYGISTSPKSFNTEADLVIVNEKAIEDEVFKLIDTSQAKNYVIAMDYNQKYNSLNLQDEMKWIKNNLF